MVLRRCKNGRTEHHTCRRWAGESAERLWSLREPYYFQALDLRRKRFGLCRTRRSCTGRVGSRFEEQATNAAWPHAHSLRGVYDSRRPPDPNYACVINENGLGLACESPICSIFLI